MSLEAALAENTATMKQLIAVFQSGALLGEMATAEFAISPKRTSKSITKRETVLAPASNLPATNDGKTLSVKLQQGDPEGTRYIHIPKHSTVAAVRPGEPFPRIEGTVEVDGEEYTALKTKYSPQVPSPAADAPSASPAASPAPATQSASTASSSSPATSAPAALDGPAIVAKCQALHKVQGNEGLKVVLDKFGATRVPELAAKTEQFAEIAAHIEGLLNPQPAAQTQDANLFGG